jgi:lipopolysaccharide export LptBFGC system permease protein LptF
MHDNPYKPLELPEEQSFESGGKNASPDLKRLASRQRQMLFSFLLCASSLILMNFIIPAFMRMPRENPMTAVLLTGTIAIVIVLGASLFWFFTATFLLANALLPTLAAILCVFVSFIPILTLGILFALNYLAIKRFRKHGIMVGFMGISPSQLDETYTKSA